MNHAEKVKKLVDDLEHSCDPEAEPPYVDNKVAHAAVHAAIDEMQAEIDLLSKVEFALEKLVEVCNKLDGMSTLCEVISAEAALERCHLARKAIKERGEGHESRS